MRLMGLVAMARRNRTRAATPQPASTMKPMLKPRFCMTAATMTNTAAPPR